MSDGTRTTSQVFRRGDLIIRWEERTHPAWITSGQHRLLVGKANPTSVEMPLAVVGTSWHDKSRAIVAFGFCALWGRGLFALDTQVISAGGE